ncbi:uncharacterized protein LY89DRAFT_113934 [Mollisia scopiformis]|uniref:Uncharacterized protein n=1 Tax=Mollisia scopiformis TaxID=149040 RepID=A0A194X5M0_MOLSC|nr:uncharacterized protein LY89DRAFT_113934 [Mollisia scopiformis]KUJ15470.1 hypothetical protein LY89DRAFT_113934 [Mollisia scopiformis]
MAPQTKKPNRDLVIEHITYDSTHQDPQPTEDIATYLTRLRRREKREKVLAKANASGRYLRLSTEDSKKTTTTTTTTNPPPLKRKEKFSDIVMAKLNHRHPSSAKENEQKDKQPLLPLKDIRTLILEGKLERVIPPPTPAKKERLAPPAARRRLSKESGTSTTLNTHQKKKKKKKKASDLVDNILQAKFHSPFEHIPYPSLSSSRRTSSSSSSSSSSFCCIGEESLKTGRRSGEGTSLWYNPSPSPSRPAVVLRDSRSTTTTGLGIGREIKPTPPLKDVRKSSNPFYSSSSNTSSNPFLDQVPITFPLHAKAQGTLHAVPVPSRVYSQRAEIVDADVFREWSACYERGDYEQVFKKEEEERFEVL